MLKLYTLSTCPYSAKVRNYLDNNKIPFTEIDARQPENEKKLIELGGKRQTPYLVDEDKNVAMYESDDIISYLKNTYPILKTPKEGNPPKGVCTSE